MKARHLLLLLLLLPLSACHGPQSIFHPAGPAAQRISHLGWYVNITFSIAAIIVFVLLIWAVTRRTGSLDRHEPWDIGGGQGWIIIGGFLVPTIILFVTFVLTLSTETTFPVHSHQTLHPDILVIGHQWWWEVHYLSGDPSQHFVTANEIHIPTGRPIDIQLQSADVIHSFWVPALHGKVEMIPGLTNYLRVQATHAGAFPGECAQYCGEQHPHMRLLVVAQPPAEYQAWRNQQLKPAAEPQDPEAMHGRDVFNHAACPLCHSIRGTEAQGKVAPDLTHLASRQGIAANSYKNDVADLEAWVTHAQSLKPGAEMPNITAFNGADLRALVAYLRELN